MSDAYFPEVPEEEGQQQRSRWRDRVRHVPRAAMIAGLACVLAIGGAGVAFAAGSGSSSTSTPSTTTPAKAKAPHGPFGRRGPGPLGGLGGLGFGALRGGGVLHGTVTIRTSSGDKTVDIQVGTAKAVSSSSITVQSTDGFTQTYVVTSKTLVNSQAAGINSVAPGDQVNVQATVSGSTATATNIVDTTKIKSSRTSFGFGPPPANGGSSSSSSNTPAGATFNQGPGFGAGGPAPAESM